jgi:geranylgeranyl diphosphate synthase type II
VNAIESDLQIWLETRRQEVERALDRYVPERGREPAAVWEAMRYSLLAGGKRLRPLLVLAAAEACAERLGRDPSSARSDALPAACALEMIHTYSLIHDDLPAMDNDVLRRGRPTAHVVYGEGLAILAGDALLTEAFALLAREPLSAAPEAADRRLATIAIIADAAGASGMVGGQAIDLRAAAAAVALDGDELRDMHRRKTAALIRASALAGACMSGAPSDMMTAIGEFGEQVGLAFQIVDDILDVEGASAELGKTAGKDAAAGKPTYPAIHGLERSRTLAGEAISTARQALDRVHVAGQLPALAQWVVGRQS